MKKEVLDQHQNKSLLLSFTIEWHEGFERGLEGIPMTTWKEVQDAFNIIYNDHGNSEGYSKVKVVILWNNGKCIVDRIDVGNSSGDYNPKRETVGQYLMRQTSVMYESNLQVGDRLELLSFEDEPGENEQHHEPQREKQMISIELSAYGVNASGKISKL